MSFDSSLREVSFIITDNINKRWFVGNGGSRKSKIAIPNFLKLK